MVPGSSEVERHLRREQSSLFNCVQSIYEDSLFVQEIRVLYPGLPLFANLRCGLWYAKQPDGTCYFKSTDGHFGEWSFSEARLNLNVAEACAEHGGCIIVDATRRGKRFPVRLPWVGAVHAGRKSGRLSGRSRFWGQRPGLFFHDPDDRCESPGGPRRTR